MREFWVPAYTEGARIRVGPVQTYCTSCSWFLKIKSSFEPGTLAEKEGELIDADSTLSGRRLTVEEEKSASQANNHIYTH
jgi:hypothetical protein